MATVADILQRLRDALSLSDPEWDVSVGTPEYKIMEALATEIQSVYNDGMLADYHFDIDTKIGPQLDDFVGLFGIIRLQAKRATGTVIFSRGTPADQNYDIPFGTQVLVPPTSVSASIYYQTSNAATVPAGQRSVEVPIEAVVGGSSGNVVAGAISAIGQSVGGVTSVVNANPITGGTDQETDDQLRQRWKATVFRNLAGTEDQFIATAIETGEVSRVNVVGAIKRYREQLQVPANWQIQSQLQDTKYTYPSGGELVGTDIGTLTEVLAVRNSDYSYQNGGTVNPPIIQILAQGQARYPVGTVIDIESEYLPKASRNDPVNGILHRIDLFIDGVKPQTITEELTMDRSKQFIAGGTPDVNNYFRVDQQTRPVAGNYLMQLFHQPIVSLPPTITVGVTTYVLGTDYWLVRDQSGVRGSTRAASGIEWRQANSPATGAFVFVTYVFNRLIRDINELVKSVRLVGTDTLVHSAQFVKLRFNLAVVFNQGASPSSVTNLIQTALTNWLSGKDFQGNVQLSDVIDIVHNVDGVDNVRLTKVNENPANPSQYGIQQMAEGAITTGGIVPVLATYYPGYPNATSPGDIYLFSDQLPVLESVNILQRGQNTF